MKITTALTTVLAIGALAAGPAGAQASHHPVSARQAVTAAAIHKAERWLHKAPSCPLAVRYAPEPYWWAMATITEQCTIYVNTRFYTVPGDARNRGR